MIKSAKEKALEILKGNWGEAIVISLIYSLAMGLLSSIGVGTVLFSVTAGVCYMYALIQASKRRKYKIDDLFIKEHFNNVPNQIGTSALSFVYILLWSLLLIIPGIIKSYAYRLVNYISLQEPELPPTEVLKKSEQLMNGKKWDLFIFDLSFFGWMLLSALTYGVGSIFLAPYKAQAEIEYINANIMQVIKEDVIEV